MSEHGSNGIGELYAALAAAQAEFPPIKRNQEASATATRKYKYADLAAVLEAVRLPLAKHGFAIVQPIRLGDTHHILVTRLLHKSGGVIESEYALANHDRPQEMGSELTYARRYSLSSLLGVSSEDDDDGAAAQQSTSRQYAKKEPYTGTEPPFGYRGPTRQEFAKAERQRVEPVPAPLLEAPAPGASEEHREFFNGDVRRKAEKYKLTTEERMALQEHFLKGVAPAKCAIEDLHKLYLFLGDPQAVVDWRAQMKAGA